MKSLLFAGAIGAPALIPPAPPPEPTGFRLEPLGRAAATVVRGLSAVGASGAPVDARFVDGERGLGIKLDDADARRSSTTARCSAASRRARGVGPGTPPRPGPRRASARRRGAPAPLVGVGIRALLEEAEDAAASRQRAR